MRMDEPQRREEALLLMFEDDRLKAESTANLPDDIRPILCSSERLGGDHRERPGAQPERPRVKALERLDDAAGRSPPDLFATLDEATQLRRDRLICERAETTAICHGNKKVDGVRADVRHRPDPSRRGVYVAFTSRPTGSGGGASA